MEELSQLKEKFLRLTLVHREFDRYSPLDTKATGKELHQEQGPQKFSRLRGGKAGRSRRISGYDIRSPALS